MSWESQLVFSDLPSAPKAKLTLAGVSLPAIPPQLDNNEIGDQNEFPYLPALETLWLNHNNISRLELLLDSISGKFPSLTYLSLLKNPCCANYLVGKGTADYRRYRITVLSRLPTLKFLDSSPVTPSERQEAEETAKRVFRPSPDEYSKPSEVLEVKEEDGLDKIETHNPAQDKAAFGQTKYVYYGRHSEGNRFIVDKHL